jgi:hypothetical protein
VTLAMVLVRAIPAVRAVCLFVSQMLGALLASVILRYLFPENFNVRTTLGGGASLVQGVFIEAILTAELVFTIFMLAKEKHRATFIAPVGIGLALFIAEMVGVQFTGGSLNPARSFGPCAVTATFDPEHWIYWVGPLLGSLIAVCFYKFIKTLEYEVGRGTARVGVGVVRADMGCPPFLLDGQPRRRRRPVERSNTEPAKETRNPHLKVSTTQTVAANSNTKGREKRKPWSSPFRRCPWQQLYQQRRLIR